MATPPGTPVAPPRWSLWHPQQRLWNRPLVSALEVALSHVPILARLTTRLIVLTDSLILLGAVLRRRWRLLGLRSLGHRPRHRRLPVLHIDCGVHEDGLEIRCLERWLGDRRELRVIAFEAGSRQFAAAGAALAGLPNLDLRHEAVVGPDHIGPTVTLYRSIEADRGYADSTFPPGECDPECETVPAVRLSDVLRSSQAAHAGPVILRMNIEGAELAVIEDLIAAGLHRRIDGYYGMWDDLSRIDAALDARLRETLRDHGIATLTFNGRDLGYALRRLAIRIDVASSIRRADIDGPRKIADAFHRA
jgi:FkbM family methyltransferase